METLAAIHQAVAVAYDRLEMPAWPSPRGPMDEAREDEYSVVSHPERYRIVHTRARVWVEVLGSLADVDIDAIEPVPVHRDLQEAMSDRGTRLSSRRPNTLPLLLLERDVHVEGRSETLAVLHVRVARADVTLGDEPDCGCDACDSGSADLLQAIDDMVIRVVGGPFVALQGKGWASQWWPDGGSAGGGRRHPNFDKVMALSRRLAAGEKVRLPRETEAFIGQSWLG